MNRIYFDNCLTSQPAPEVVAAMLPYLRDKFYFPKNFILDGSGIQNDLDRFRNIIAASMGAEAEELHITSGGTSANNIGIKGYLMANAARGNHIILSVIDYPDLLTNASFFEKSGYDVTYLTADPDGFVKIAELKQAIKPSTVLFMTTLVNHVVGAVQPIQEIRKVLDSSGHKIALFADACEAYGRIPLDVNKSGVDLMTVSAHKIHGPQGVGALYQRRGIALMPVKHGVNRVDNLETGGVSTAAIAGFAKAVELTFQDFDKKTAYIRELSDHLLHRLETEIPHIMLNGPRGMLRAPHNVNVSIAYIEGEAIMVMLDLAGIMVATGSACASQGLKPNYVLMALGRNHEQSHGSIKFTLSRYNTREEIDLTVEKLKGIVAELRSRSPLYNKE